MATDTKMVRVAVDAMGGDNAPAAVVAGAVEAARQGIAQVVLVGDPREIESELAKHSISGLPVGTVPSVGVITEDDQPALALRQKPQASIVVTAGMIKKGEVDASVTMGSTGAAMAAAAVVLGVMDGIDRPAIGGPIIGTASRTIVVDLGTNVDCRPTQILGFAVIGTVFARVYWGMDSPRVALLSIGSESGKGNRLVKDSAALIAKSHLNFIGNVEANDLTEGKAEVVVCDGFVGNIVMKLTEGLGSAMAEYLRSRLKEKVAQVDLEQIIRDVYEINNQVEILGGGPLLGVKGVSIVGHGRGNAESVCRAIVMAVQIVNLGFVPKLSNELKRIRDEMGEGSGR